MAQGGLSPCAVKHTHIKEIEVAIQKVHMDSYTGLTSSLSLKAFVPGSDTVVQSVVATPGSNNNSHYTGDFVDLAAGTYSITLYTGTTPVDTRLYVLALTTGDYFPTTGGDSAADVYSYFTDGNNEDAFKADVSNIDSAADVYSYFTSGSNEDASKPMSVILTVPQAYTHISQLGTMRTFSRQMSETSNCLTRLSLEW